MMVKRRGGKNKSGEELQRSPTKEVRDDESSKEMVHAMSGLLLGNFGLAKKPKDPGSLGRKILVRTNLFRIMRLGNQVAYHYDLKIEMKKKQSEAKKKVQAEGENDDWIEIKTQRMLRPIFKEFHNYLRQPPFVFAEYKIAYDGVKNIYVFDKQLPSESGSYNLTLDIEGSSDEYRMTYQYTNHQLNLDLNLRPERDSIQALEVALGYTASNEMIARRQDLFPRDSRHVFDIGLNLELRMGTRKSVRWTQAGFVVNIDQAAAVFEKGGSLDKIVTSIINFPRVTLNTRQIQMNPNLKDLLQRELKGFRVLVMNPKVSYKRKYKIEGITIGTVDQEEFDWTEKNKIVTISQYNQECYGHALKYRNLPCILTQNGRKIPIEMCELIPEQYYGKKLGDKIQAQVTGFTIRKPNERMTSIQEGLKQISDSCQQSINCTIDMKPLEAPARIMQPPVMNFRGSKVPVELEKQRGNPCDYSLQRQKLNKTIPLNNWVMIQVLVPFRNQTSPDNKLCAEFAVKLAEKANAMGWNVNRQPKICHHVYDTRNGSIEATKALEAFMRDAWIKPFAPSKTHCQLLFLFKPTNDTIYQEIKTIGNKNGFLTQCLELNITDPYAKEGKVRKMTGFTFLENMILKMNAKMGGTNAILDPSTFKFPGKDDFLNKKGIMILGVDVAHPGVGSAIKHSVAGFVGSYTDDYTQYFCQAKCQEKERQEVIQEWIRTVEEVSLSFFRLYKQKNGQFPSIVVVYRDGVSEGQFMQVRNQEVAQLQSAMKTAGMMNTKLVYVTVQKRHHFRMFNYDERNGYSNVKPGTVIDTHVVHPDRFECYLNSHHALQGSARPSHYCVIYNDCEEMGHDLMETMSYYLTYLCARCPKPISLPIPVRYAHLVCEKASMFLSTYNRMNVPNFDSRVNDFVSINPYLSEKLFYA